MQKQKILGKSLQGENMVRWKKWKEEMLKEKKLKSEEKKVEELSKEDEKKKNDLLENILIKFSQLQKAKDFYYDEIDLKTIIGEATDNPIELQFPFYFNIHFFDKNIQKAFLLASSLTNTFVNIGDFIRNEEIKFAGENNCKFAIEWNSARLINLESLQKADAVVIKIGYVNEIIHSEKITKEIAIALKIKEEDFIYPSKHFDIENGSDLKKHVELLRNLTDYRVPIIVKLGIADVYEDVINAIKSKPDAIEIYSRDDFHIGIFASIQRAIRENKTNAKILFSGFIDNPKNAFKCLCLGASAIGLTPSIEEELNYEDNAEILNAEFLEYAEEIKKLLAMTGHKSVKELSNDDLMASDYNTASITGLRLIGYDRQLPMWEHL